MNQNSKFPKGPIKTITGMSFHLSGNDIDTDRIIPARFLKCISFDALGDHVFADDRKEPNKNHPFDDIKNTNKSILIVDKNFGCGSSREHAPQALMRWGIRGIIGQSFAEIFYGNCLALGIPCVQIPEPEILSLINSIKSNQMQDLSINIQLQKILTNDQSWNIEIGNESREMLLSGEWDATSKLISQTNKINITMENLPYLNKFQNFEC